MQKFLKLYVSQADETGGDRLVAIDGILQVIQASTTTVTISYNTGISDTDVLTITHGTLAANSHEMRDYIVNQIEKALQTSWQTPIYTVDEVLPDNVGGTAPITIVDISLA
tara:strand:- start:102 stop:434 length:333 start_codon:yes stop_codon:yes gene_type:complete